MNTKQVDVRSVGGDRLDDDLERADGRVRRPLLGEELRHRQALSRPAAPYGCDRGKSVVAETERAPVLLKAG